MEEILIIITAKYYDRLAEMNDAYASTFNVPKAVYLALLTGGEPAIKSYFRSNSILEDNEHIIRSATMTVAPIIERGRELQLKNYRIPTIMAIAISPTGEVLQNGIQTSYLKRKRRFPKELVKTTYSYINYEKKTITYEAIYAAYEDGTYEFLEQVCTGSY